MLLAAKVLVISRLLHTKLSKRPNVPPYLETLRGRLARLRRKILSRIDYTFKNLDAQGEALIGAMLAFTLATSSSPTDVVRHFHHLRLIAMGEYMDEAAEKQERMLIALRLYVKTLRDTQAIVPGQLSLAMQGLKAVPIFKSPEVNEQIGLSLDVHDQWISEDIKAFTPYIRHDELTRSEAEGMMKSWAKSAIGRFLRGLKERIQSVEKPSQLMHLRKVILELWLSHYQHSFGVHSTEILDALRDVFSTRAIILTQQSVHGLSKVDQIVLSTIRNWEPGVTDALPSLWSPTMTSMETSNGAKQFRQKLMDLSTGKNEPLSAVYSTYQTWLNGIKDIEKIIQEAKNMPWDDNLDVDEEELLGDKQTLLSEDDPRLLEDSLRNNLDVAFTQLSESLSHIASTLKSSQRGSQAAFLLRTWREIQLHPPSSFFKNNFGLDAIHSLLQILAVSALTSPLESCSKRLDTLQRNPHFPARPLWEGDPELPVMPSPWAYRLLLEVIQAMARFGTDVWSPEAVKMIKREMTIRLTQLLEKTSQDGQRPSEQVNGDINRESAGHDEVNDAAEENESSDDAVDGNEKNAEASNPTARENRSDTSGGDPPPKPDFSPDKQTQQLFDIFYLIDATAVDPTANNEAAMKVGNGLLDVAQSLKEDLSLENRLFERLKKNAADYWKRTALLFGLLTQ